jgi:uncharacterized protein YjbI with pentapeptide repeats
MINLKDSDILSKALVGCEFEFYSNTSIEDTAKAVGALLKKKIRVEKKAHSEFQPSADEFKMEPDMSGGAGLIELVTGAMPYSAARLMIIKVCKWIEENGYTTERSSIHLNLSFDSKLSGNKHLISKMSPLKFILDFNEDLVWKEFPNRKDSTYAKSIKFVIPRVETYSYNGEQISQNNFIFPKTKYYGVNFDKLQKNYLEFRYLGGENWHKKSAKILNLLDLFIIQLWKSSNESNFNELNKLELKKILSDNKKIIELRVDWRNINKNFPKCQFTVDLDNNPNVIDLYWPQIKESVSRLFTHGQMDKGHINYDSNTGRVQVNEGNLPYCFELEGYEFIGCTLQGELKYCDFFKCDVNSSDIRNCNFYQSSQINNSKVGSCHITQTVNLKGCYVYGTDTVFKGTMRGGIFREGMYEPKLAKFDDVEVVTSNKIVNVIKNQR